MSMPVQLLALAAERVLNSIPEGVAVAGLTWLLLRIMGRNNSGARFAVWFAALLAVAALPFIPHSPSVLSATGGGSPLVLPAWWAGAIFAVWLVIAGWAMLRVAIGLGNVRRLRMTSVAISGEKEGSSAEAILNDLKPVRRVEVRRSGAVTVPTAVGFFRPMILLPGWALDELSAEDLKAVLSHELAHLRRWDDWTNLAQKLIRTVFFFHPAVWWIERKLSLEREMACDDMVVAETENPRAYAECLVNLAERSVVRRGIALAQAVVGRARETAQRLSRILDGHHGTGAQVLRPALGAGAALAAICAVAMPYRPNLVSFEERTPTQLLARGTPTAPNTAEMIARNVSLSEAVTPKHAAIRKNTVPKPPIERAAKDFLPDLNTRPANVVMAVEEDGPALPQHFFVVVQTMQVEGRGPRERLSVWRVTVKDADRRVVHEEFIVRSL